MPKEIIAIDADDTILDESAAIIRFHNEKYGTHTVPADYLTPGKYGAYWGLLWGTDDAEADRRYEEYIVAEKIKQTLLPLPGAIEVLQRLKQRYELVIITARGHRVVEITHKNLEEHYPGIFKDVHFVPLWGDGEEVTKAEISQEIGAKYLIDDCFEHCVLAAEAGVEGLVYGVYGWNNTQELQPHMTRVKDWTEVEAYFDARS